MPRGSRTLRASDADREEVAEALRRFAGEGRLTIDELSLRLEHAYEARTLGDLRAVVADLPGGTPPDPITELVGGVVSTARRVFRLVMLATLAGCLVGVVALLFALAATAGIRAAAIAAAVLAVPVLLVLGFGRRRRSR